MSEENIYVATEPKEQPAAEVPTPVEVPSVPEPIAAPVVEVKPEPMPEVKPVETPRVAQPVMPVAVSGKNVDEVYLAKCVYKNKFERKSLTVHHLQRRLTELGYHDASSDKDGYLGDLTQVAIEKFQKDKGLSVGQIDEKTFSKIFQGDPHVNVNL